MKKRIQKLHSCHYFFLGTLLFFSVIRFGLYLIEKHYEDQVNLVTNFPVSSQVFDRHGKLLYEYFNEVRRIPVQPEKIPQYLRHATLMAEDERFFQHAGFDPLGIVRAFWRNWRANEIQEGASTLGQQLIKNTVLGPSEGYGDKLEEVLFSIAIDARLSKQDILNLYINTIPYGSNVYGAEAASRYYFGKSVQDTRLSEAALLAALPKHPTYLSPYGEHVKELFERRDYILQKMHEKNYISDDELATALSDRHVFVEPEMPILAPHFVMFVRDQVTEVLGEKMLEEGGLMIKTTLDYDTQKLAENSVALKDDLLKRWGADSTGLVAVDTVTGEIMAMVGNRNYFDTENAGNFNMAVAKRQPGSSFKPFVYAGLLDRESFTPASVLLDIRKDFSIGDEPYIPRNYDNRYRGPITLRDALARSLNVPAVQALMTLGIDRALDFAEDMGISTLEDRSRFGPSLVLGGAEVTLVDMVSAYSSFANDGMYNEPVSILEISKIGGGSIDWHTALPRQVMQPETAYQISSILSDNHARAPVFGRRSALSFYDRTVAAKTGTTQEYRDAWTVGFTPDIAVGVWVGNHDNQPLYYGAAGALAAAPIWREFMGAYLEDKPATEFERPKYLEEMNVQTILGMRKEYVAPWQINSFQRPLARRGYNIRTLIDTRFIKKKESSSTDA